MREGRRPLGARGPQRERRMPSRLRAISTELSANAKRASTHWIPAPNEGRPYDMRLLRSVAARCGRLERELVRTRNRIRGSPRRRNTCPCGASRQPKRLRMQCPGQRAGNPGGPVLVRLVRHDCSSRGCPHAPPRTIGNHGIDPLRIPVLPPATRSSLPAKHRSRRPERPPGSRRNAGAAPTSSTPPPNAVPAGERSLSP